MATEITTLDKVKTRLGITNSSKDDALTLIVDAVNDEFVDWSTTLNDGDKLVFIPPVAGG